MWTYFFYGTLLDTEVARSVLGRPLGGFSPRPGRLDGYRRVYVSGATYPALSTEEGASVDGALVFRVGALEAARLRRFEGPEYETSVLTIEEPDGTRTEACVFLPKPAMRLTDRPWSLEVWRRQEKRRFMSGMRRNTLV